MEMRSSRVLIVDDMSVNRMIISSLLASNGVLSDKAEGGHEAISLCEENDYDLILLDHRMPDMDGIDTLQALKELFRKKGREVPVICHTTEEGRSNINLYKAAGFADVLIKPIDPKQLSEVLMTYLPEDDKLAAEEEDFFHEADMDDLPVTEININDELDKLPLWLKTVPHIDLVAGLKINETAEDYVDALYIFHSSIGGKSDDIEANQTCQDWTMYRLGVHSLKSMSRLVGAKALSEKAAMLEKACEDGDYGKINRETPALLSMYRDFSSRLAPLMEDEEIRELIDNSSKPEPVETVSSSSEYYNNRNILFIHSNEGIVSKGIETNLKSLGYKVITVSDEPDMIVAYRHEADIVIYYPNAGEGSHIPLTMSILGEICQDDDKLLCLVGDMDDVKNAMTSNGSQRVSKTYLRPVNIGHFTRDIDYFSGLLEDFHRKKTLFLVDDDRDYLSVVSRWLSPWYNVSCFHTGEDLLSGLLTAAPDLILLDYEMPELDGYQLLKNIRKNPDTLSIPIIFLTGKNDHDHVVRILEYKPDGYLLKTSQKDALTDAIRRFFSETLFSRSKETSHH